MEDIEVVVDTIDEAFNLVNEYINKCEQDPNYKISNQSITSNEDGKYIVIIKFVNTNTKSR